MCEDSGDLPWAKCQGAETEVRTGIDRPDP